MRIVTRWKPLFCCMVLFAVTLSAQQPDLNAPDVRQKEGGYVVRRGDSLSRIAKRYGIYWRDLQQANDLKSPNIIHVGTILRVPGLATAATPLQFRDPDGRKTYPNFPWVEIPTGREGTVTARFDAFWENAVIVYEVSGTAAVAELLRFGTAGHHNQHTNRKLQAGKRYYFAPWHKVPDENKHISEVGWTVSRARLHVTGNGYQVQVDDSELGRGGDLDYNDAILTIVIK